MPTSCTMSLKTSLATDKRRNCASAWTMRNGRILQQGYNAEFTEYGMVTRDDFQPMDAPWQDESEVMDMQIT